MNEQPQTLRRVAENEAAKQAVVFAFAVATIIVMAIAQARMYRSVEQEHPWLPGGAERRMRQAQQSAERWDRIAAYCFRTDMIRLANMAHKRAESAREAYERERYV